MKVRIVGDEILFDGEPVAMLMNPYSTAIWNFIDWIEDANETDDLNEGLTDLEEDVSSVKEKYNDLVDALSDLMREYGEKY